MELVPSLNLYLECDSGLGDVLHVCIDAFF